MRRPIFQVGWFRACSGVTSPELFARRVPERTAGSRQVSGELLRTRRPPADIDARRCARCPRESGRSRFAATASITSFPLATRTSLLARPMRFLRFDCFVRRLEARRRRRWPTSRNPLRARSRPATRACAPAPVPAIRVAGRPSSLRRFCKRIQGRHHRRQQPLWAGIPEFGSTEHPGFCLLPMHGSGNASPCWRTTSSVLTPMEPVDPKTVIIALSSSSPRG